MASKSEDLPLSAAGLLLGHRAFQEFLLAGERHVVGQFERPGAERRFARFYRGLPKNVRNNVEGYFRRQSLLDLSQRAALLGPFVKLDISTPLNYRTLRNIMAPNASIRSELDALSSHGFASPTTTFSLIPSIIDAQEADALAAAGGQGVAPRPANAPQVKHIDLLLQEVTVENSNDDDWIHAATDTVHLAVTTVSESGEVEAVLNKFGSRDEGKLVKFPDVVLATIDLDYSSNKFPRTFSFKIDAVEKDDGTYNDVLQLAKEYAQEYVTEEMIEKGIIAGGAWLGVPIPPPLAKFVASYLKGWFDDAIDWLFDIFDNDDDLIGTYTRMLTLSNDEFEFKHSNFLGIDFSVKGPPPLKDVPFTHIFSGSGGRWRVKFCMQLR
jgi:hypothetical protein